MCNYCRSEFQVDNTKEEVFNFAKGIFKGVGIGYIVFIGFIILIFLSIIIFSFITFSKKTGELNNGINQGTDFIFNEADKKSFNSIYEFYSGTSYTLSVESLIDEVVTNNKTNNERIITISYKEKTTSEPNELINLKHSFFIKSLFVITP